MLLVVIASMLGLLLYNNYGRLMKSEIGRFLAGTVGDASTRTMVAASAASGANDFASPDTAVTTEAPAPQRIEPDPPASPSS